MKTNRYHVWLEAEVEDGNITDNTASSYLAAVRKFEAWAGLGDDAEPSTEQIEGWITAMADDEGLSAATIRNHYFALKNYFGWHPELDESDMSELRAYLDEVAERSYADAPPALTDDQMDRLVAGGDRAGDSRVAVAVRLLRLTGMTSAELRSLGHDDVDLDAGTVHLDRPERPEWVHRTFSLTDDDVAALRDYLSERDDYGDPLSPRLIVTQRGGASADTIQSLLRRAADDAGIDDTVTPTRVRNWVGGKLAREGYGAQQIAAYLGLSSLQQAGRYLPDDPADRSDQLRDALLRS